MKDSSKILKFHLFHFIGFFLFMWISFFIHSNRNSYETFLGMIFYFPFAFLLTGYNLIALTIANGVLDINGLIEKYNLNLISYGIPMIPILIWYFIADFLITFGEWEIKDYYFWSLILVWGIMNFSLYLILNKKQPGHNTV